MTAKWHEALTLQWSRGTNGVDALDKLAILSEDAPYLGGHPGHDPHAEDHIVEVSELDAHLGQRPAHWTHAEGNDVHHAALHAARETILDQLLVRILGAHPLTKDALDTILDVGDGLVLLVRDDEGLSFHTSNVSGISVAQVAITSNSSRNKHD